jgi:hypothetical protein
MSDLPLTHQMYAVADFKDYETERSLTAELSDATNVITSVIRPAAFLPFDQPLHNVVLDLDLSATLLPSSTPGHFHLFIERPMTWETYLNLIDAMVAAGLVEPGYRDASATRGHTAVRLPWIKKGDPSSS